LQDVTPAYWDERIAVNLRHQYFCAQAVAPAMRAKGRGVILNLGSISWHLAQANLSIYLTAKAGIEGLTRGLARDLGVDGIRVNCIIPGAVRTPRQDAAVAYAGGGSVDPAGTMPADACGAGRRGGAGAVPRVRQRGQVRRTRILCRRRLVRRMNIPAHRPSRRFRSQDWFDNPEHIDMTALYLERFMNYGITAEELRSGRPIIGIAQSGSDISPCNRIHLELAQRVRDGIRDAGGIPMEFPLHPIFENCRRPTAALDRNLAYLGLVEILHGYPIDAVVLTTGCDKTTPAQLMAAATVDIPAIVLSGGPMLDGWMDGELVGSGAAIWKGRRQLSAGLIDNDKFLQIAAASAPSRPLTAPGPITRDASTWSQA